MNTRQTLELACGESLLSRLPGSMCSGWEGRAGSISSQGKCSLCWSEWFYLPPLCLLLSPCQRGSVGMNPGWVWLLRSCGSASWQSEGTPGPSRPLWMRELKAWLTLGGKKQGSCFSYRHNFHVVLCPDTILGIQDMMQIQLEIS